MLSTLLIFNDLSGGACVSVYSDHQYGSKDLDYMSQFSLDHKKVEASMKELGFERRGKDKRI